MAPGGREQDNRYVFNNARLKALFDRSGDRSAGSRRFYVAGPLTAKLRCNTDTSVFMLKSGCQKGLVIFVWRVLHKGCG